MCSIRGSLLYVLHTRKPSLCAPYEESSLCAPYEESSLCAPYEEAFFMCSIRGIFIMCSIRGIFIMCSIRGIFIMCSIRGSLHYVLHTRNLHYVLHTRKPSLRAPYEEAFNGPLSIEPYKEESLPNESSSSMDRLGDLPRFYHFLQYGGSPLAAILSSHFLQCGGSLQQSRRLWSICRIDISESTDGLDDSASSWPRRRRILAGAAGLAARGRLPVARAVGMD
jgi:hypothetical protein